MRASTPKCEYNQRQIQTQTYLKDVLRHLLLQRGLQDGRHVRLHCQVRQHVCSRQWLVGKALQVDQLMRKEKPLVGKSRQGNGASLAGEFGG